MTAGRGRAAACALAAFFLGLSLLAWLKEADRESESERRRLEQFPELSAEAAVSGEFMEAFENYALDQFPWRDAFRSLKAFFVFYVYGQKDNHGIYVEDGYAARMEYPLREEAVCRAAERFSHVCRTYMEDTEVSLYFCVIPDKNCFLAGQGGHLSMDYDAFYRLIREKTGYMQFIDITRLLAPEDYYKTDIHWRQERLVGVAREIAAGMGVRLEAEYEARTLDRPFYGVYYGQSALPLQAERLQYLTNRLLEQCTVYDFQNGKCMAVYDMEKAYGRDPYEMFLSGPLPLLRIENPAAPEDKELILFRDSFGSSLAPLLAEGYASVTLVDIRYIHPDLLGRYLQFHDQDVLFLYSVPVLNQGEAMK